MKQPVIISLLIGLILLTGFFMPPPVETYQFKFLPQSEVTLKGASNVNTFSCYHSNVTGSIQFTTDPQTNTVEESATQLNLQITGFDCGNPMMESDMREALKASNYPKIKFTATSGKVVDRLRSGSTGKYYKIKVSGKLKLAGTSRSTSVIFTARQMKGHYQLTGTKTINMTDYGISPPSAMFGMIKAKETIHLHFDLAIEEI